MSEQKAAAGVTGTVGGWIKALLTSVVGLVGGAVLMYLTPLVNSAIKPPKPVANFAVQVSGQTVNFNNRSTGATQGWWDFGDGSALEPFDPNVENIKRNYAKPGSYTVKLTLQNLLGDDSDRATTVNVEASPVATKPEISDFKMTPLVPGERVPAVYRLEGKVQGATHCILSVGDERPTEIVDAASVERYLTFNEMGAFTVRLAAVNGKQLVEKLHTVYVSPGNEKDPMAKLLVTYDAVRVDRLEKTMRVMCGWHGDAKDAVSAFRKERPADVDSVIVSAELMSKPDKSSAVRNAAVAISPDRKKVIVTGELTRPTGMLAPKQAPPSWLAEVKVVMERRSPLQTINRGDVMMTVNLNSTTKVPLQPLEAGWEVLRKKISLELWDGSRKAWEGDKAVTAARVTLKNQTCLLTAIPQNDGYVLKIDAPNAAFEPMPIKPIDPAVIAPLSPPPDVTPAPAVGPIRKVGYDYFPLFPKRK